MNALSLTGADRSIVLKEILRARLIGLRPTDGGSDRVSDTGASPERTGPGAEKKDDDVLDVIGAALKVDRDMLELVYAIKDGEPQLVVSSKRIAANKATATRQLAQLIAAARQVMRLEEWTPASAIRKVVQEFGRLDTSNFAASIQQLDNVGVLRGKGQQRELKITRSGLEDTAELIKTLASADA